MRKARRERLERQRQTPPPPVIGFQRYPSRETIDARVFGFMHICMINHYKEIIQEQIKLMVDSGLYEKCTSIFVGCVGSSKELEEVRKIIAPHPKIIIEAHFENLKEYEYPTLTILKQKADKSEPFYAFYIHTKGVSYPGNEGGVYWRDYMNYYNITKWRSCYSKLKDGYQTCGVKLIPKKDFPMHYSGNFFWAKSSYVKTLKPPREGVSNDRFAAEMWLCRNNPMAACLCDLFVDYNTKGKFSATNTPTKKAYVHTLCFNLHSEVKETARLLYEQNSKEDFKHIIVDLGFPIRDGSTIPTDIDAAKKLNTRDNLNLAIQYGAEFISIKNEGVSQNWEQVRKYFNIKNDEVLICADPDERPHNKGWVRAISEVISEEPRIGWVSLMMPEHMSFMKKENLRTIAGHDIYIMQESLNWAQGGFNGKFLNEIGGVPIPEGAPIYGWIESACMEKMKKKGYVVGVLANYKVSHTECSQLYRRWKTQITSHVKNGQMSFESWIRDRAGENKTYA